MVVCWHFELLPRWALALLAARELFDARARPLRGMRRGIDLKVNWLGRAGVWPVMGALFFAMAGVRLARPSPACTSVSCWCWAPRRSTFATASG